MSSDGKASRRGEGGGQPRRSSRVPVKAELLLRRSGRNNYRVRVFDASPQGCKVEFVERPQLDEQVWVRFDGLEAVPAAVCWIDGFYAGLEFNRPIHDAVFDNLIEKLR